MYFNTHTHLNSDELYFNRAQFIAHALENEVEYIVVAGYDLSSPKRAVEIAHEYPFIYATVGTVSYTHLDVYKRQVLLFC